MVFSFIDKVVMYDRTTPMLDNVNFFIFLFHQIKSSLKNNK